MLSSSSATPVILGHRGDSAHAPENSLAAFRLALAAGADGIECDAHLIASGAVVIMHDATLDATTTGAGPVSDLTEAQLRDLRLRPRDRPIQPDYPDERIPTLEEVLREFARPGVTLNVEIKPSANSDLAEAVARCVKDAGASRATLLSSFDVRALDHLRAKHPDLRRALLFPPTLLAGALVGLRLGTSWLSQASALGCEAVHPLWRLATPHAVQRAHHLGLRVTVWTVDDGQTIRRLVAAGADGLITNDPAATRRALWSH